MRADDKQEQEDLDRVDAACRTLIEHFDSVQILCTRDESGELEGTIHLARGLGNWFARYGCVRSWLVKADEGLRAERRED